MLSEQVRRSLQNVFASDAIIADPAELVTYEFDAGLDRGSPDGVVFPRSAEELVTLVRWANEYGVSLIARGAGTGLSGGAVAERGGIVVEFSRMNRVIDWDTYGRRARVEPGVTNISVDNLARKSGLYFPPDPSSQRASTIGGNVAENAGGPHCFKYGVTTNYVTGMNIVLADATRVSIGGQAMDFPEYDLGGLLTGSEGTLALYDSVSLRFVRNPPGVKTMMAVFDTLEQSGAAVSAIIAAGLVPATMELLDRNFTRIIEEHAHAGIPTDAGAVLIIEVDGYPASLDPQINEIADLLHQHGTRELRIAKNEEERDRIWYARKSAAGALSRLTPAYYMIDTTVPRSRLAETISESNRICADAGVPVAYAFHAGDGNLHPVLLIMRPGDQELAKRVHDVAREIIALAVRKQGSLTGEHGVGIEKREYMPIMYSPAELSAMLDIKNVFDPHSRFNPGKMFPADLANSSVIAPRAEPATGTPAPHIAQCKSGAEKSTSKIFESLEYVPENVEQAAEMLTEMSAMRRRARIGSTTSEIDRRVSCISTRALAGIKTYAPDDLYITVGAGTLFADLDSFLHRDRKQVSLASPWPGATLGGLVAANANAPLRIRYGSIRDMTLALTVVLADGRTFRAGRPVIKNVAGYDLTKAFIGSHGTLGLIADVTLKLTPLPRVRRTLRVRAPTVEDAIKFAGRLLPLALVASAIILFQHDASYVLAYTAEGLAEDVETELDQVCEELKSVGAPEPSEDNVSSGTEIWASRIKPRRAPTLLLRVGVAPRAMMSFLRDHRLALEATSWVADLANSLLYVSADYDNIESARVGLETFRRTAVQAGGYAVVMDSPAPWRASLDLWGLHPETLDLMRRLKRAWDPTYLFHSEMYRPISDAFGGVKDYPCG